MAMQDLLARADRIFMKNVGRLDLVFVKGKGARLWDADGKEYIDFLTGVSVTSLGHTHPAVTRVLQEQAEKIVHVSNYFYLEEQIAAAERLADLVGLDRVFWSNSGAEANEAAIKLARKYGAAKGKYGFVSALKSFHGRTLGALSLTGQPKYQDSFRPLPEGFTYAPLNDLAAWERAIGPETCALVVEPVQGEGGVYPATTEFLAGLRELCDRHGLLLIFDEVQTGFGRTGKFFAWQHTGIKPDILTTAKTLGAGIPIGAMLAKEDVAAAFTPGDHSTTIGGGGMAYAAALAVMDVLERENLPQRAWELGEKILATFREWGRNMPVIKEARGLGLMLALDLTVPAKPVMLECLRRGLIVNAVTETALRLLPPLNIAEEDLAAGLAILKDVLNTAGQAG